MTSVQIKNVPAQTHEVLRRRAAQAHQSLQEYLLARLIKEADEPNIDEVLDIIGSRSGGRLPAATVVKMLREDRARR